MNGYLKFLSERLKDESASDMITNVERSGLVPTL